jgi:hypothetical protein
MAIQIKFRTLCNYTSARVLLIYRLSKNHRTALDVQMIFSSLIVSTVQN